MAQPDNITMLPDSKALIIAEDGKHINNMLWLFDLETQELTRIATLPEGAEATSPYFSKVGNYYYMSLVVQHPAKSEDNPAGDSITGFIGPFIREE